MDRAQRDNIDRLVEKHKGLDAPAYNGLPFDEYTKDEILAIIAEAVTRGSFVPTVYGDNL